MAITLCLGTPADVYLIDEPSAYLDAEQRVHAAKVIKRHSFTLCDARHPHYPLFSITYFSTASFHKTNLILQLTILQFRFIMHSKKTAFIVEHDFIMATYMADKVLVFEGQPGFKCTAHRYFYVKEILNLITSLVQ